MSTAQGDLPGTGSTKGPLREQDNYPTPPVLARAGWEIARGYLEAQLVDEPWSVCEPGCGDDQPFLAAAAADPRVGRLSGYDVRPVHPGAGVGAERTHLSQIDWLHPSVANDGFSWDAIITNPPFSLAEPFIRRSLARVAPNGVVLMLVRMTFLGSLGRLPLWREYPPTELAIIVPRPSFVGGGSDTNDYAFVVWAPGRDEQRITWCTWAKPGRRR